MALATNPDDQVTVTVQPERVSRLAEFIDVTTTLRKLWQPSGAPMTWHPWFRGQASKKWGLQPKIYRPRKKRRWDALKDDLVLRREFERRARQLTTEQPADCWEW